MAGEGKGLCVVLMNVGWEGELQLGIVEVAEVTERWAVGGVVGRIEIVTIPAKSVGLLGGYVLVHVVPEELVADMSEPTLLSASIAPSTVLGCDMVAAVVVAVLRVDKDVLELWERCEALSASARACWPAAVRQRVGSVSELFGSSLRAASLQAVPNALRKHFEAPSQLLCGCLGREKAKESANYSSEGAAICNH